MAQYDEPNKDNLTLVAGYDRTWEGVATLYNTSTEQYEVADISGGDIDLTVTDSDGTTVWTKTGTLTDPTNGVFTITFEDTDSDSDDIGTYDYIVEYTTATSEKYLLVKGKFYVV